MVNCHLYGFELCGIGASDYQAKPGYISWLETSFKCSLILLITRLNAGNVAIKYYEFIRRDGIGITFYTFFTVCSYTVVWLPTHLSFTAYGLFYLFCCLGIFWNLNLFSVYL